MKPLLQPLLAAVLLASIPTTPAQDEPAEPLGIHLMCEDPCKS